MTFVRTFPRAFAGTFSRIFSRMLSRTFAKSVPVQKKCQSHPGEIVLSFVWEVSVLCTKVARVGIGKSKCDEIHPPSPNAKMTSLETERSNSNLS